MCFQLKAYFCRSYKRPNPNDSIFMKGVLLVNLGSPDSPTPKDVKPYLDEFLMDERVIDAPKWLRAILVRGIIAR